MTERIERDVMYMEIAKLFAQRSSCLRGQTGTVLVRDGRPVGGGYNGAPSGLPHCSQVGCEVREGEELLGCQRAIHAEANAIAWAARNGVATEGAEMFCVSAPCKSCAQLIVAAKIKRVVWLDEYRLQRLDILQEAGVEVFRLPRLVSWIEPDSKAAWPQ